MVEAMDHIDATLLIAGPDAEGGKHDKWLRTVAKDNPRVQFLGRLTPEKALQVLQRSHISIQMADPRNALNSMGPYNRLFDAMSVGRAVIATEGTFNGDAVRSLGMGLTTMYDKRAYVATVNLMLGQPDELFSWGVNGLMACHKTFNWDSQAKKMVAAYESLECSTGQGSSGNV
jgi:glycosyltransferase involved in cell wall biosynthesis